MRLRSLVVASTTAALSLLFASPASAGEPGPHQVQRLAAGAPLPKSINVQLYSGKGDAQKQLRLVRDGVRSCELDVVAHFVEGSVSVTDVDGDGKSELTFAYDLACRGDISANIRKLLVLEHKDKHALRGTSRLEFPGGVAEGGGYKSDAFKKQPALKALAESRWKELLGR